MLAESWRLHYRSPAAKWEAYGLPIGNGRLGAVLRGTSHVTWCSSTRTVCGRGPTTTITACAVSLTTFSTLRCTVSGVTSTSVE
ncbi:glycoside hydrolase N-terminal domain-containing protein [Cutibacterium acnes]